jgi:tRNA (mo5U34)-methyltransferase
VAEVAEHGFWHHDMEVVPGVRTAGTYDPSPMLDLLRLPARLDGARVLDIGCNDGFFSFALEARGAEVTAVECGPHTAGFMLNHRLRGSSVKMVESTVYELAAEQLGPVRPHPVPRGHLPPASPPAGARRAAPTR